MTATEEAYRIGTSGSLGFGFTCNLDKHFDIELMNLFCKVAIRGIWLDKAMMTSQCVLGWTRHKDLNDFFQPTHNDCTVAQYKYHSGDP